MPPCRAGGGCLIWVVGGEGSGSRGGDVDGGIDDDDDDNVEYDN